MRILVTGAGGQLGPYIVRRLLAQQWRPILWTQRESAPIAGLLPQPVQLTSPDAVDRAFAQALPQAVVHCAAISNLAEAHADPARAAAVNVDATRRLATRAAEHRARMIYLSTDLVFDGEQGGYIESDPPRPLSVYGRTKLAGEACAIGADAPDQRGGGLVIRLPLVIGPTLSGRTKFFDSLLASLKAARPVTLFDDEWRTPVSPLLVAEAVAQALQAGLHGLYHLAGPDRLSRYEIGAKVADLAGADHRLLKRASRLWAGGPEPRPRDTSMRADKWYAALPAFPRPTFDAWIATMMAAARSADAKP